MGVFSMSWIASSSFARTEDALSGPDRRPQDGGRSRNYRPITSDAGARGRAERRLTYVGGEDAHRRCRLADHPEGETPSGLPCTRSWTEPNPLACPGVRARSCNDYRNRNPLDEPAWSGPPFRRGCGASRHTRIFEVAARIRLVLPMRHRRDSRRRASTPSTPEGALRPTRRSLLISRPQIFLNPFLGRWNRSDRRSEGHSVAVDPSAPARSRSKHVVLPDSQRAFLRRQ